jgi:hypothetical protein
VNGFVRYNPAVDDSAVRQPGISWMPWNVQVPFFSAVPDILANDIHKLDTQHTGALSKIGFAIFSLVGAIDLGVGLPMGIFELRVPAAEVLQWVMDFVRLRNQPGRTPADLTAESALSYVLNESYAALHEFEARTPDSRVQQPGAHA